MKNLGSRVCQSVAEAPGDSWEASFRIMHGLRNRIKQGLAEVEQVMEKAAPSERPCQKSKINSRDD